MQVHYNRARKNDGLSCKMLKACFTRAGPLPLLQISMLLPKATVPTARAEKPKWLPMFEFPV